MTVAAAYARFSSDSQREESIEIQLREINRVIEREGFVLGHTYKDEAVSGWQTHGRRRREDFDRCIEAGERGLYDVLVVYKMDRFARNVEVSQQAKKRLFKAGVRIISVREGEIRDTPDGFLMSLMSDGFAEYYSRNLSVLVRDGIDASARQCKAAGRRIFGYDVDDEDHFVINETQGEAVREIFRRYLAGETSTEICRWLNGRGIRTSRGKTWCTQNLMQMFGNVAYKGVYKYSGHVIEGGIPALVSEDDFDRVAEIRKQKRRKKRRSEVNEYLLTGKIYCLECGRPMCGTAGTSGTGKKYTYYGCMRKDGGCGIRVSSEAVESKVMRAIVDILDDEDAIDEIVRDMRAYAESRPNHAEEYRQEASRLRREADRLIQSIAEGIPASSVAEALREREDRIADLEKLALTEDEMNDVPEEAEIRAWLDRFAEGDCDDPEWRALVTKVFVSHVFADKEDVFTSLNMSDGEPEWIPFEQVRELKNVRTLPFEKVRTGRVWWGTHYLMRTPRTV